MGSTNQHRGGGDALQSWAMAESAYYTTFSISVVGPTAMLQMSDPHLQVQPIFPGNEEPHAGNQLSGERAIPARRPRYL
jgi:hypothetical protein